MSKLIGLTHLSDNEYYTLLLVAVIISLVVGYVTDMIMGRLGWGVFGNSFICMLGIVVGLYGYNRFYGRMSSPDITIVSAFAIASVILHLVSLTIIKRVFRL
jgi:uncharacterized membrane protein YeaQ/YmgE (transglycosylase-associated protein family)